MQNVFYNILSKKDNFSQNFTFTNLEKVFFIAMLSLVHLFFHL